MCLVAAADLRMVSCQRDGLVEHEKTHDAEAESEPISIASSSDSELMWLDVKSLNVCSSSKGYVSEYRELQSVCDPSSRL